jgi:peroxiredoxin
LREAHSEFERRDASVAAVTQGPPSATASLCERHQVRFRCFADPTRQAYAAFGLGPGSIAQVMGPQVLLKATLSAMRGNVGLPGGDIFQMPGTFVIGRDGIIRLAYRGGDISDLPSMDTILAAL